MAGSENHGDRTEMPSERRLLDAIAKGKVPVSRDINTLGFLLAMTVVTGFLTYGAAQRIAFRLVPLVENPAAWRLESGGDAAHLMRALAVEAMIAVAPIVGVLALCGLAAAILQNRPAIVFDRISPKAAHVSLRAGWQRVFGAQSRLEFAKAILKITILAFVTAIVLGFAWSDIVTVTHMDANAASSSMLRILTTAIGSVTIAGALLAMADLIIVRMQWKRSLKMTRQELKQEHREHEGDPVLKARRRSRARDRMRRRMIAGVPRASIVIANPTHFAVALRYVRAEGGAPRVVAKGQDYIALEIRRAAEEHGIPIVEDKALARSLHDRLEVNQMIPPEFYKVVAEILTFLRSRGRHRIGHG
jgi:flagellar biosynthesis protein FlhB